MKPVIGTLGSYRDSLVLTVEQMQAAESTCFDHGLPPGALMEQAVLGMAAALIELFPPEAHGNVVVLAGCGGNGADGYGLARALRLRGYRTHVVYLGSRDQPAAAHESPSLLVCQRQFSLHCGVVLLPDHTQNNPAALAQLCAESDLIIDSVFGAGFRGTVPEPIATCFEQITKALARRHAEVPNADRGRPIIIAVDGPSGLPLNGTCSPQDVRSLRAQHTFAIGHLKPAHVDDNYARWMGSVRCLPLAMPPPQAHTAQVVNPEYAVARARQDLSALAPAAHKYQKGLVHIAAGSAAFPGAAQLVVAGSLAACPGYLRWMVPPDGFRPDLPPSVVPLTWSAQSMTSGMSPASPASPERPSSWVLGPGRTEFCEEELSLMRDWPGPIVLDAGALRDPRVLSIFPYPHAAALRAPRILTPHRGEFQFLWEHFESKGQKPAQALSAKVPKESMPGNLIDRLRKLAGAWHVTVVLKGATTLIAEPSGRVLVHPFPNPELAAAGTGDVLAGFLAALLARGLSEEAATAAAVSIHGLAARVPLRSPTETSIPSKAQGKHAVDFLTDGLCYPTALARAMSTWLF